MRSSRREFLGLSALSLFSGCARIEQSRLGQLTPDFEFGGDGVVRFAAIGDLHLVDSRSVGIVGRAVNRINNDPDIDFVAVLGDLTQDGTLPQMNLALQALGRLEKPYFCVPGEHDVNSATEDPYEFYRRTFRKTQWRNNIEGWIFIGLDTCNGEDARPAVPQERLDWLDNQLDHADKRKPLALLSHHSLAPGVEDRVANADDILARLREHNFLLAASAHTHGSAVETHEGVLFVTTPTCSSTVAGETTGPQGFQLLTLDESGIAHEFVSVS